MDLILNLIPESKMDYKCYDELKKILFSNEKYRSIIEEGFLCEKITAFSDEIWEKIRKLNVRGIDNFEDVFLYGFNIGSCTSICEQLSYSFNHCFICGGRLPLLEGTKNSPDGSHTWISYNEKIIDTTLMLIIDEKFSEKIGYIEENRYNPNMNPFYRAAKEWANDPEFKKQ